MFPSFILYLHSTSFSLISLFVFGVISLLVLSTCKYLYVPLCDCFFPFLLRVCLCVQLWHKRFLCVHNSYICVYVCGCSLSLWKRMCVICMCVFFLRTCRCVCVWRTRVCVFVFDVHVYVCVWRTCVCVCIWRTCVCVFNIHVCVYVYLTYMYVRAMKRVKKHVGWLSNNCNSL